MNPYRLKNVFQYLTSNNQLLKKKLKLGTSEIPIPPKRQDVIDVEVINRFTKANPRVDTTNLKPLSVKQSKEPDMKADGGRIGYKDGPKLTDFLDVQASGSKTGKNQIEGAPKGITADSETINAIIKADIPVSEKINLLATYGYGKGRTRIDYKDQEIFLDEGGYKDRNVGIDFNRDGEGFSGSANYGIDTGEPQLNIKYKKSFADGGMLVQPSDDGSRPGYRGSGDREYLDQLVEEANKGFKFVGRKELQAKAGYSPNTNLSTNLDKLEIKFKKAFDYVMNNPDKPVVDMFDPMKQIQKLVGSNDSVGKYLKGYKPYESSKLLIKTLASPNSKSFLRKAEGLTLGDLEFRIDNNVKSDVLFAPPRQKTNETKIMDIVDRHIKQGGTKIEWVTKPEITKGGYSSYGDAVFKYRGKDYDLGRLINEAKDDPNFKEFFKAQREYKTLNDKIVTHPKTKEKIRFGNLMKEVYGNTGQATPYNVDHAKSILDEPFTSLRVLPARINKAAGNIQQKNPLDITNPELAGKYSDAGKEMQFKKIGYNYDQPVNNLIESELKLADDVLNKGRVLRKPNEIIESIRKGENYIPDFYSKDAKPGKGFEKIVPEIKKLMAFCPAGTVKVTKAGGGRIPYADGPMCTTEEAVRGLNGEIDKIKKGNASAGESSRTVNKLKNLGSIGMRGLVKAGLVSEVLFEAALGFDKVISEGQSPMQAFRQSYLTAPLRGIGVMKSFEEGEREELLDIASDKGKVGRVLDLQETVQNRDNLINKINNLETSLEDQQDFDDGSDFVGNTEPLQKNIAELKAQLQDSYRDGQVNRADELFSTKPQDLKIKDQSLMDAYNNAIEKRAVDQASNSFKAQSIAADDLRLRDANKAMIDLGGTYLDYKNPFTKDEYENFARKEGYLPSDKAYTDKYFTEAILNPIKFEQLMETPGFKGASDKFASGGIASLTDTIPPESGPTPQGLPYVYNNVKKI